ncbi:SIS domain-containing protein [Rhizodiscina lignyota]|uniref:SIS domain-containing protein n=1 Tax=Rhizodiscina lignyota TaxID=1504668 RepID=A0A9P4I080_9PEZI|nr:SIS domain-containing protein [Rhizodiscina lignyota]
MAGKLIQSASLDTTDSTVQSPRNSIKRRPSGPLTPPISPEDAESAQILDRAVHILATEASALSFVTRLYQTNPVAKTGLLRAVECILKAHDAGGKLIICGVGKSGIVGMKIVATMKSLGVATSFMHAAEAVHGDLGDIKKNDVVLFITYSGRTQELMTVSSHINESIATVVMTSHMDSSSFPLCRDRPDTIVLPAPIHEPEEKSFGVCAPTTSTTVAMAVGDMLSLTVAERLHLEDVGAEFQKNHPGGTIGAVKKRRLS